MILFFFFGRYNAIILVLSLGEEGNGEHYRYNFLLLFY